MSKTNLMANAEVTIDASAAKVWQGLTDPRLIKSYMMGADVKSDWKKGSDIVWMGEWQGKPFEDRGKVLDVEPNRLLRYSHISSSGEADKENQHTVTVTLSPAGQQTELKLTQDNNTSEKAVQEAEKNWNMMLGGLKKVVEKQGQPAAANH